MKGQQQHKLQSFLLQTNENNNNNPVTVLPSMFQNNQSIFNNNNNYSYSSVTQPFNTSIPTLPNLPWSTTTTTTNSNNNINQLTFMPNDVQINQHVLLPIPSVNPYLSTLQNNTAVVTGHDLNMVVVGNHTDVNSVNNDEGGGGGGLTPNTVVYTTFDSLSHNDDYVQYMSQERNEDIDPAVEKCFGKTKQTGDKRC